MKCLRIILFLFLIWSCSNNSNTDNNTQHNWLLSRGDTSLSGYTKTKLPESPVLLWSYKSGARTASSPVVNNGTVYWCDKRGKIYGVDIQGNLVFNYDMQTAVEATPMISDSILYIGRIDGSMSAVSLSKKDTLWNFETMGQVSASPNIANFEGKKAIVFGSYDNFLYCIHSKNGKKISRFKSGYYINGAVALWKEYVVFGGCDSWIRIINTVTGITTDSLKVDTYVPASPAISDDYCYIADHSGNVYELLLKDGKIAHSKKIMISTSESSTLVSVPAVSDKIVFILSDDRNVYAIDRKDGSVKWKFLQKGDSGESSPVICNDKVMVCTKTGIVSILDAKTGKLIWEYDTGEQIAASPAIIKDHFYIVTTKGTLFCFGEK
ncbi:MAG: PQQ-binding-like beta-propeller repeat protein [Bacteroidales bacterium]|jgi:outer membrane protein assembly factor BamB|nr:PQQ-binding-like beta-propeller repeat protein [Bacteroidales bacterium]